MALTLGLILAVMAWSCAIAPRVYGFEGFWVTPRDAWVPMPPAHSITLGAFAYQYESTPLFVYLPGLPIVLTPIALLGDRLDLSETLPWIAIPKPQLWLLLGPYGTALALVPLYAMRRLWTVLGARRHLGMLQLALAVVSLGPVVFKWGHYEEALMLGLLLIALRLLVTDRSLAACVVLGAAIVAKQTALLAAPVFLFHLPRDQRLRGATFALAPAVLLGGICLAFDWAHAGPALLGAHSFPALGRAAIWAPPSAKALVSTPFRVAAVVGATAIGFKVREETPASLLAGVAASSLLRLVTEPVLFAYYLGVPIVLVVSADFVSGGPWRRDLIVSLAAVGMFVVEVPPALWWLGFGVAILALGAGPVATVLRPSRPAALWRTG